MMGYNNIIIQTNSRINFNDFINNFIIGDKKKKRCKRKYKR